MSTYMTFTGIRTFEPRNIIQEFTQRSWVHSSATSPYLCEKGTHGITVIFTHHADPIETFDDWHAHCSECHIEWHGTDQGVVSGVNVFDAPSVTCSLIDEGLCEPKWIHFQVLDKFVGYICSVELE
jgi:hypothetical protein